MPRTSLLETPSTTPAKEPELAAGATEVIEAATAEAAIAEVHDRLGPDARIVDARRGLRGGIGGFFAKEVVQLHAAAGPSGSSAAGSPVPRRDEPVAPEGGGSGDDEDRDDRGIRSPIDRLLADAPETVDFATFLKERMVEGPEALLGQRGVDGRSVPPADGSVPPAEPEPATAGTAAEDDAIAAWRAAASTTRPTPPATAVTVEPPAPVAGPAWSSERLLQLGLPTELVRAVDRGAEADDLAWTSAVATAVAGACGALPTGASLVIGPLADRLTGLVEGPTARSQVWFDALRDGRWLHLVVGGEGWREHLLSGPCVVSWTRQEDLPEALRCALELGLTLGYGPIGGVVRRARPVDIALAVRELVDAS